MLLFHLYLTLLRAAESHSVIELRLRKIAARTLHAGEETQLMVSKKIYAVAEAGAMLVTGKSAAEVIDYTAGKLQQARRISRSAYGADCGRVIPGDFHDCRP
jgi:hypothetical protein